MNPSDITSHLFPGLRERFLGLGFSFIAIKYDGGYGDRLLDDPYVCDKSGKHLMEVPQENFWQVARIDTFLLAWRFPDWDQEEGSKGRFIWNLHNDTVNQVHKERVTRLRRTALCWISNPAIPAPPIEEENVGEILRH